MLDIASMAPDEVVERFADHLLQSSPRRQGPVTVAFMNMRNFVAARQSPAAVSAYSAMDEIYPDGVGLQIGRHLARLAPFPRVSGTDTVPLLLARLPGQIRVFLLGGNDELSAAAASRFSQLFPHSSLAGAHPGFVTAADDDRIVAAITDSKANLLLLGMGSPLQEQWLARNRHRLPVRLAICVGGLFHYWAGDLHRAPEPVRAVGLEWLWILAQQPFKWRVYCIDAASFGLAMRRFKRRGF